MCAHGLRPAGGAKLLLRCPNRCQILTYPTATRHWRQGVSQYISVAVHQIIMVRLSKILMPHHIINKQYSLQCVIEMLVQFEL